MKGSTWRAANTKTFQGDISLTMRKVGKATKVCMGEDRRPIPRSEQLYRDSKLTEEMLSKFVDAGLLVRSGEDHDPFYKFVLDPVAEELDVSRLATELRDKKKLTEMN
jgi:hypothetical protein